MMMSPDRDSKPAKLQYTLTGFKQESEYRVFNFERVAEDRTRTNCSVKADLAMSRRYGIPMQDLPLLCRSLLERRHNGKELPALTFTEEEMCMWAKDRTAMREAAASKRKPPRRPPSPNLGTAWRGQQQT